MHKTLKQSKATLAQSLWEGRLGLGGHQIFLESSKHLWQVWGLILNAILPLLPSYLGFSFALGIGITFFLVDSNILLSMVVQQLVATLEFTQEKMST